MCMNVILYQYSWGIHSVHWVGVYHMYLFVIDMWDCACEYVCVCLHLSFNVSFVFFSCIAQKL